MMVLKEKVDKDLVQYNIEFKELMRIIEYDRKFKEFMRVKSEERVEMMEGELLFQRKKKDEKERGDKVEEIIEVGRILYVKFNYMFYFSSLSLFDCSLVELFRESIVICYVEKFFCIKFFQF